VINVNGNGYQEERNYQPTARTESAEAGSGINQERMRALIEWNIQMAGVVMVLCGERTIPEVAECTTVECVRR
jgi:hypothetical protein